MNYPTRIQDKYVVISITVKQTKNGDDFWLVELMNKQGSITGKVWSQALPQATFRVNTVALIEGSTEVYQGAKSIIISRGHTLEDEQLDHYLPAEGIPTLVFDIETVGLKFEELDPDQQSYLIEKLENRSEPEEAAQKTGLHPLFGFVTHIAALSLGKRQGYVFGTGQADITPENPTYSFSHCANEAELLSKFWRLVENHQRFVTYNGHGFDFPFLAFRSAVNKVRVPIELKYNQDSFIDLMSKLRPYPARSYSLAMVTRALGITNPKEEGVSGADVAQLYRSHKHQQIVDYVARDVEATTQLYSVWKQYLAGKIVV